MWLSEANASEALQCHTNHLSTFTVLPIVAVTQAAGCAHDVFPTAMHCPPDSPDATLRLTGTHFGITAATVRLSAGSRSWTCDRVSHVPGAEDTSLLCTGWRRTAGPPLTGALWAAATVTTHAGLSGTAPRAILFVPAPQIATLLPLRSPAAGLECRAASPQALTDCPPDGASFGVWGTGFVGYGVEELHAGPYRCPLVVVRNASYLECHGLWGTGTGNAVSVAIAVGLGSRAPASLSVSFAPCDGQRTGPGCAQCKASWYGPQCSSPCPASSGHVCSGHGRCDDGPQGTGVCTCDASTAAGYWAGAVCGDCVEGHYGPACASRCLGAGVACSGHGVCDDGPLGTGACACTAGYGGVACALRCPVGDDVVCSGHGLCRDTAVPGVGACACDLQWTGAACEACATGWTGPQCADCVPGHWGAACRGVCPGGGVCGGHGTCRDGVAGNGTCACARGYGGVGCAIPCPGLSDGAVCGGHGACTVNGTCNCEAGPAGHWAAPRCTHCSPGWSGSACDLPCPQHPVTAEACSGRGQCVQGACLCPAGFCGVACETSGGACADTACGPGLWGAGCANACPGLSAGAICAAHGTCLDGPWGSGTCLCSPGFGGADCGSVCPANAGLLCSGHGACDAQTARCVCTDGYAGPTCTTACPRSGAAAVPCGGPDRGTCHDGVAGNGSCSCRAGYAGPACQHLCPGAPVPCNGHGACNALGLCVCTSPFAGANCTECVSGAHGPDCGRTCVRGYSIARLCVCHSGWAGPDCATECGGGSLWPCSGHGRCRDGGSGDGGCACDAGWAGPACALMCRGGAATPCSGHGVCRAADGGCDCYRNARHGHWAGEDCAACVPPYTGADCLARCPTDMANRTCGGHGSCAGTAQCHCTDFFTGPLCQTCRAGYFGPDCAGACPGGACQPCSGHGTCSDGPVSNGTCVCTTSMDGGFWGGDDCSACAPGHYGPVCLLQCPRVGGRVCAGHGRCREGVAGDGHCACDGDGRWAGVACAACAAGFYGANCSGACPTAAGAVSCSGHGVCDDGLAGTGDCSCSPGYVGPDCGVVCARDPDGVPCGHGSCVFVAPDTAECQCHRQPARGYWSGTVCSECAAGYAGPACTDTCPPDCSGHGVCPGGRVGTGTCTCDGGWGGARCDIECPGGAELPCNGRGVCGPDGACACDASAVTGFWAGAACLSCAAPFSGPSCTEQCPVGADGGVCSAHGVCLSGHCLCEQTHCGPACELTGATACAEYQCTGGAGRWGPACTNWCPGAASGAVCGGHGVCSAGPNGTGGCYCGDGWSGPGCTVPCPGDPPCSARGFCSSADSGCQCLAGFAGQDCHVPCPGTWPTFCSGHGQCRDGAGGDGLCMCDLGYAGHDCSVVCPGGAPNPCSGHGACSPENGTCACDAQWAGAACGNCAEGWYGLDCDQECLEGTTVGHVCVCDPHWALPHCSRPCRGGVRQPCTGHGVCADGNAGDGSCTCGEGWRGPVCDRPCPGLVASGVACSGHGLCDGHAVCACDAALETGFWAGAACDGCAEGWVGEACDRLCPLGANGTGPCSGHGTCDPVTEQCICHAAQGLGFWADASNCTECLPGYYGPACDAQCPGGACDACSGHGTCEGGVVGTGACRCDAQWTGPSCSQCDGGWYGLQCNASCPEGIHSVQVWKGAAGWGRGDVALGPCLSQR